MRFQGDQYVATCSASAQLTSRQLGELIALFDTYQFGALRTSYTREHWTDDSTVITQYRPPGAPPMHVEHYHGDTDAPARLTVLEDRIDTVIGTMEWVTGAN